MGPFAVAELRAADLLKKHGAPLPPGGPHVALVVRLEWSAVGWAYGACTGVVRVRRVSRFPRRVGHGPGASAAVGGLGAGWEGRGTVRTVRGTDGAEREDRGPTLSGVWSASAVLLQYLRTWAG
jgi:hypothetical protein